ncbi:MAG: YfcE family phosphodiesterase [Candidatus Njordarchaeota archaeon]
MHNIVVWGDSHIPYRAERLPNVFIEFLRNNSPQIIVCTGDLVVIDVLEQIKDLGSDMIVVRGNMDEGKAAKFPPERIFDVEGTGFYVYHGHGIYPRGDLPQLYRLAKKKNADVLLTGHTHHPLIEKYKDIIIINPGSVCGVWGGGGGYGVPTWAIINVDANSIKIKILESTNMDVKIYGERSFEL